MLLGRRQRVRNIISVEKKLENMAITVVLPRAALELVVTRSHSLSFVFPPVGFHSLEFAHFLSISLELARLVLQNHSVFTCFLHAVPHSSNESICYAATKFCENILIGVGDVTAKSNSKNAS